MKLATMYEQMGDIIQGGLPIYLKRIATSSTKKAKEDKYKKDQKEAFHTAAEMLKIALGENHPYTQKVIKKEQLE